MTDTAAMKTLLEDRKAELLARLTEIEAELESHEAKDWEEQAVEREGEEVLEGMGVSGQQELRMIDAALGRIASGDYGFCAKCGAEIAPERLAAVPYTPFCRACAQ